MTSEKLTKKNIYLNVFKEPCNVMLKKYITSHTISSKKSWIRHFLATEKNKNTNCTPPPLWTSEIQRKKSFFKKKKQTVQKYKIRELKKIINKLLSLSRTFNVFSNSNKKKKK